MLPYSWTTCVDSSLNALQETKSVFEKLHKFLGKNLKNLVERTDDDHVFRLHKNRIFYVREGLLRRATNVSARSTSKSVTSHSSSRNMQA